MSRLLDALLKRTQQFKRIQPPAKAEVGVTGLGPEEMRSVNDALIEPQNFKIITPQEMEATTGSATNKGYARQYFRDAYSDVLHGGDTIPKDRREIAILDSQLHDPGDLAFTWGHELGHTIDRSRYPGFAPKIPVNPSVKDKSEFLSFMHPDQINHFGRDVMGLNYKDAHLYQRQVTGGLEGYREGFHGLPDPVDRGPGNFHFYERWFPAPSEQTADALALYMLEPNMMKSIMPQTHEYLRNRLNADSYWAGKIDFKSLVPPAASATGAGLAGFDKLEAE